MTRAFQIREFEVVGIDASGWLVSQYRGIRVLSYRSEYMMELPGHPCDSMSLDNARAWIEVIDAWLDSRSIPPALRGTLGTAKYRVRRTTGIEDRPAALLSSAAGTRIRLRKPWLGRNSASH
jgi:hypothetical protein